MRNSWYKKGIVLVIIVLFLSVTITPTIGISNNDDTTPPVTTHSINGTEGENGFYISDVEVTLNATDDLSGVNVTYYTVDVPPIPKTYTEPFWVRGEAGHLVCYYSVDYAGNEEEWKCVQIPIDLYPPEVYLGYSMTSQGYKLIADADDSMSMVDRVEFYLNDELVFTDYDGPYEWDSNLTHGGFFVHVFAYDRAGHQAYDEIWIRNRILVNGIIYDSNSQIQYQSITSQQSLTPLFIRLFERLINILRWNVE